MGMLEDLDLEEKIKNFTPAEQFLARELYEIKRNCPACHSSKKQTMTNMAGITGFVIAVIEGIALWIRSGGGAK